MITIYQDLLEKFKYPLCYPSLFLDFLTLVPHDIFASRCHENIVAQKVSKKILEKNLFHLKIGLSYKPQKSCYQSIEILLNDLCHQLHYDLSDIEEYPLLSYALHFDPWYNEPGIIDQTLECEHRAQIYKHLRWALHRLLGQLTVIQFGQDDSKIYHKKIKHLLVHIFALTQELPIDRQKSDLLFCIRSTIQSKIRKNLKGQISSAIVKQRIFRYFPIIKEDLGVSAAPIWLPTLQALRRVRRHGDVFQFKKKTLLTYKKC